MKNWRVFLTMANVSGWLLISLLNRPLMERLGIALTLTLWIGSVYCMIHGHYLVKADKLAHPEHYRKNPITGELE